MAALQMSFPGSRSVGKKEQARDGRNGKAENWTRGYLGNKRLK